MATAEAPVLWSILEEHLDEAGFLAGQWLRALRSPRCDLRELAGGIEERLGANVEGLALAGPPCLDRILAPALGADDPALALAAALAALELPGGLARVRAALASGEGEIVPALARAVALSRAPADGELVALLADGHPAVVGAALAALARRGIDAGPPLLDHLASAEPAVAVPALRAARCSAQPVRAPVERAFGALRPEVRDAALEAGLRLGFRSALAACQRLADDAPPDAGRALQLLAASGDPADAARIERAASIEPLRRPAIVALGCAGHAGSVEAVLGAMEAPETARVAGEAFWAITGVAVEGPLAAPEPDEEEPPPLEDDGPEAQLVPDAEEELPLPDALAVAERWRALRERFDPAARYLDGRPFTPDALARCFAGASMRRRALLALELAVRSRGGHRVEPDDFAFEQLRDERRSAVAWPSGAGGPLARLLQW
jgi:uncharacterized protein (TIGR02270 family)